jgi:pre-mRNA-splicing factor ATP-dependent RNA helicase DHX16
MKMSEVISWVSDQLHSILGLSDRFVAEYLVGLAKKSSTPEIFESKIRETNTIALNHAVRIFLDELWGKVPHKQVAEKPARIYEREILLQQKQNKSYRLLSDSDEEILSVSNEASNAGKKSIERPRRRKNIRKAKTSAWDSESDEDDLSSSIKASKEDSDDEWDRQVGPLQYDSLFPISHPHPFHNFQILFIIVY